MSETQHRTGVLLRKTAKCAKGDKVTTDPEATWPGEKGGGPYFVDPDRFDTLTLGPQVPVLKKRKVGKDKDGKSVFKMVAVYKDGKQMFRRAAVVGGPILEEDLPEEEADTSSDITADSISDEAAFEDLAAKDMEHSEAEEETDDEGGE